MADGFVVVCDEDGILFGQGDTMAKAFDDAEEWIEDALKSQLRDEVHWAQSVASGLVRVSVDLSWTGHKATDALRKSIGERGGHDNWHKRPDGVLDLGKPSGEKGGAP